MNDRLISSTMIAASILIFFFLAMPAFDKTRTLNASVKEREGILLEAEEIKARVGELNRDIDSKKAEVDKLDILLPKEKMIPELLSGIESVMAASGMSLTEVNISELSAQEEIKKLSGNLKLNGSFVSFIQFLDLLEKNLRLIDLITVDVSAQLTEGARVINYDLRFEVNYLPVE